RQLRRHLRDRGDAAAVRRGRDTPAAGAPRRLAGWPRHRPAGARRIRDRSDLEERRARARDRAVAARTAAAVAPRYHAADVRPHLARPDARPARRRPAAGSSEATVTSPGTHIVTR